MFRNYFKVAFRNLWKHRLFSFINILGLGLAMSFCFMQLIQVQSGFEKDSFHPYPERTYRIITDATNKEGEVFSLASSPMPLGEKLENNQSIIEKSVRVNPNFDGSFSNGIKSLKADGLYADPAFFEVFGFKLEKGTPCVEPRTVVLSHETAERFFGDADPVGKTLVEQNLGAFKVTGVFAPLKPYTTHLKSDMVVSMATFPLLNVDKSTDNWLDYNTYTFVLLTKGTSPEALDRVLLQVKADNQKNVDFKDIKGHSFRRQRLDEISPDYQSLMNNPYVEPIWKVGVSLLMPLVIILLAGFNYVNLTLTRSLSRAREVGVRKVAGAKRSQLVYQFLIESVVISFFALGIGYLGLEFIKMTVHVRWLTWDVQNMKNLWAMFVGFTFLTGIVAGILPARILSAYQPVQILKGGFGPTGFGKISFRKSLTVIQFVVALVFMTFTGISNSQFDYMATDNESFNRKNILNIPLTGGDDFRLLANEMAKQTGVERIGLTSAPFNEGAGGAKISRLDSKAQDNAAKDAFMYAVDANFVENMKLKFIAGSNLPQSSTDTVSNFVVVNEKAARVLGFANPKDAVGRQIRLNESQVLVTGVVRNFCFMHYEIPVTPLVLHYDPKAIKVLSLLVADGVNQENITASLAVVWKKLHPHESFVYSWYEKQLYEQHADGGDRPLMSIMVFIVFTIAALGLLGMVTYTTGKRTKEVGVRKVMGASITQIMSLLSMGFVKLILIASVIAIPLGYFLGSLFLNIFTYHVKPGPAVFLTCLGSLMLIGLSTIGIQAYKTAVTNPADTLRAE